MHNNVSGSRLKLLTLFSFISILIPLSTWALWIYCFNARSNQADRVEMYNSYFPGFLTGRYTLAWITLVFCLLGIVLSAMYLGQKTLALKIVSILFLIVASLETLLPLFSLM